MSENGHRCPQCGLWYIDYNHPAMVGAPLGAKTNKRSTLEWALHQVEVMRGRDVVADDARDDGITQGYNNVIDILEAELGLRA